MDTPRCDDAELAKDLSATLQARKDLGAEYEPALFGPNGRAGRSGEADHTNQ